MDLHMVGLVATLLAGAGTSMVVMPASRRDRRLSITSALRRWLTTRLSPLGPDGRERERGLFAAIGAMVGALTGFAIYGGFVAPVAFAAGATVAPFAAATTRRRHDIDRARDEWPRMIEEVRIQMMSLGRSVPHALLDVGRQGPHQLRPAFVGAHRTWLVSTDFERTLDELKSHLNDPTADVVCETLLIAHEIGGTDADSRLRALVDDRLQDVQGRKDARARQAGVRFSRLFVLLVPLGMAVIGLGIGDGRSAYASTSGQVAVGFGIAIIGACWWWSGRLLRLPTEPRVFPGSGEPHR